MKAPIAFRDIMVFKQKPMDEKEVFEEERDEGGNDDKAQCSAIARDPSSDPSVSMSASSMTSPPSWPGWECFL